MSPEHADKTVGEISRSVDRIEATVNNLSLIVQATSQLAVAHGVKIDLETKRLDDLDTRVDSLATRSAFIAGGVSALVSAANFFFGRNA